jgi:hypothetical protein
MKKKKHNLITAEGFAPIIILLLLIGVGVSSAVIFTNRQQIIERVTPAPSPKNQTITLDFLSNDEVTEDNLKNSPYLKSTTVLPDGSTEYLLYSYITDRDTRVVFRDNQIVYRRLTTFDGQKPLPKLSEYQKSLGESGERLSASKYYGPHTNTVVFAEKGAALIANTNTDEIYEFILFTPTTLTDYQTRFGDDLDPTTYQNPENF